MHLLAISGSLRSGASNTAVLQAMQLLAPPGLTVTLYDALGDLPHFNPDLDTLDGITLPPIVAELRAQVGLADGILICSPEYAHGIPGSLKNLLDWLVASIEFPAKPVALISASARSVHARAQLTEVLTTMAARIVPEASVSITLPARTIDAGSIAADPAIAQTIRAALATLMEFIQSSRVT